MAGIVSVDTSRHRRQAAAQAALAKVKGKGRKRLLPRLAAHASLIAVSALFAYPFFFLLSSSLKTLEQTITIPVQLLPNPIAWDNYPRALHFIPYARYFANTLFIAVSNIVLTLISCSLVAYGFARIKWYGRDIVCGIVIATLMIPYTVTLIHQFLIFRQLGWIGSFNPLILPALGGNPFFIFLLRQFFRTIPQELSDAARIDGASELGIFWSVVLPLSKPALATVALFTFLWNWNDFLGPLVFLNKEENYTLAIGLYSYFSKRSTTEWGQLLAAAVIMIIPVVVLFFFARRTFIRGISMTGMKGWGAPGALANSPVRARTHVSQGAPPCRPINPPTSPSSVVGSSA